jgi:hydroxymethylpyrimidine pyrophosphatase-like HAD family hydrolase
MDLFPKMCMEIFTEEQLYVVSDPANVDEHMEREKQEFVYAMLDDIITKAWIKVILCDSHENLLTGRDLLAEFHLKDKTNNFFSADTYLEIVGKHVSKGDMLDELMNIETYQGKKVIAAGDFQNDIEMLRRAYCGIAPANAQEEVRKMADVVGVTNDEDLLYDIVYRILPRLIETNRTG